MKGEGHAVVSKEAVEMEAASETAVTRIALMADEIESTRRAQVLERRI